MKLHPIDFMELSPKVFQLFGTQTPLLTAGDKNRCNTMTIGWAQLGTLWAKPVCTVYVRPERHTYGFMESHDYFALSFLPAEEKKTLTFCGTKSGRDVDKIKECGLTVAYGAGDAPYFEEAELVLVCRKLYAQELSADCVLDGGPIDRFYGAHGNWHKSYVAEVVEVYTK